MSRKLILFPGMTPSQRIFHKLVAELDSCKVIDWIAPGRAKTIAEYADKIITEMELENSNDFLGVSFGGMIAQEVARILNPHLCFVVSSIVSSSELRASQRLLARLPHHGDQAFLQAIGFLANAWPKDRSNLSTVRARKFCGINGEWYRWATAAALRWQPTSTNDTRVIRIHGDRDQTFPQGNRYADIVIPGAGHMLALTHSRELAEIIRQNQQNQ